MAIRTDENKREKYIVKNMTTDTLAIGDLSGVPTISPKQSIDLMLFTTQEKITQSKNLSGMLRMGWLRLTRQKERKKAKTFSSSEAGDGITPTKDDQLSNYYTKSQIDTIVADIEQEESTWSVTSTSSNYTPGKEEEVILVNASGGDVTIHLPEAAEYEGKFYYIKKTDASVNLVILDGYEAETIDGELTVGINIQYMCLQIACDGTNWWII